MLIGIRLVQPARRGKPRIRDSFLVVHSQYETQYHSVRLQLAWSADRLVPTPSSPTSLWPYYLTANVIWDIISLYRDLRLLAVAPIDLALLTVRLL